MILWFCASVGWAAQYNNLHSFLKHTLTATSEQCVITRDGNYAGAAISVVSIVHAQLDVLYNNYLHMPLMHELIQMSILVHGLTQNSLMHSLFQILLIRIHSMFIPAGLWLSGSVLMGSQYTLGPD